MEKFQCRILIQHIQGAAIAYFYNRESFDVYIEEYQEDGSQFIEIGNIIEYSGEKYEVKNINFKLYENTQSNFNDYNCQIGIFVDNVS